MHGSLIVFSKGSMAKTASPNTGVQKSPARTISNFSQMKKVIKKVNQDMKSSRPHYGQKSRIEADMKKNNSLIAESGCSGFFGNHNKSRGKSAYSKP